MSSRNLRMIILDYYDSLIRQVDVYTDEQLEKYTNDHFTEIKELKEEIKKNNCSNEFDLDTDMDLLSEESEIKLFSFNPAVKHITLINNATKINWPQQRPFEMKTQDLLNFMRDEMIKQLKKAIDETMSYYDTIKEELRQNEKIICEKEMKRKLFASRSAFIFSRPESKSKPYALYLVVFDFYLSEDQQNVLR